MANITVSIMVNIMANTTEMNSLYNGKTVIREDGVLLELV